MHRNAPLLVVVGDHERVVGGPAAALPIIGHRGDRNRGANGSMTGKTPPGPSEKRGCFRATSSHRMRFP